MSEEANQRKNEWGELMSEKTGIGKTMSVSNRKRALSWPYPRRKHFEESLRRTAANWFKERDLSVSRKYPFILAERDMWPKNIIDPQVVELIEQACVDRKRAGRNFPLHKYIHHGCSSQAMLFNLIGPLVVRNDLEPLRQVFERQHVTWPDDVTGASFEFDDRTVFNEEAAQPTSIDLTLDDKESKPRVFIEAKLVESEFGDCSLFASGDCDGRNPVPNLDECYLHFIGRQYWNLLDKHDFLKDSIFSGPICPRSPNRSTSLC